MTSPGAGAGAGTPARAGAGTGATGRPDGVDSLTHLDATGQARMVDVLVSLRYIAEEVNISYPVTDVRAYYTWVAERSGP